jgi:hypothetical protein
MTDRETASPLRVAIDAIAAQHPNLSPEGWHFGLGVEQKERCRVARRAISSADFERQVLDVIVDVGSRRHGTLGSYGLKHRVEARCGRPVTSGAAIVAMLILGYEAAHTVGDRLQCRFRRPTGIRPHSAFRGPNTHEWAGQ